MVDPRVFAWECGTGSILHVVRRPPPSGYRSSKVRPLEQLILFAAIVLIEIALLIVLLAGVLRASWRRAPRTLTDWIDESLAALVWKPTSSALIAVGPLAWLTLKQVRRKRVGAGQASVGHLAD